MSSDPDVRNDRRSRFVHLDGGQARDPDANLRTMVAMPVPLAPCGPPHPFEALFVAHYRAIRALGRSVAELGVAIVAIHVPSCRLVARAWIAARAGEVQSSIVGRHSEADVLLDDPRVSLRHLAVLLSPPSSWDTSSLAYELLDLRTPQAFLDERGRQLEALRAEGPALVALGPFALFFLPTGDPTDWPELATEAWSILPPRVFVDERHAEPDRFRRGRHRAQRMQDDRHSAITLLPSVVGPDEGLLRDGEPVAGHVRITSPRGARRIAVGASAIARGILLGRYERCDAYELFADTVSRAHLLVKSVDGDVVAIDTASTAGTYVDGKEASVRVVALGAGEVAVLADEQAFVRWER